MRGQGVQRDLCWQDGSLIIIVDVVALLRRKGRNLQDRVSPRRSDKTRQTKVCKDVHKPSGAGEGWRAQQMGVYTSGKGRHEASLSSASAMGEYKGQPSSLFNLCEIVWRRSSSPHGSKGRMACSRVRQETSQLRASSATPVGDSSPRKALPTAISLASEPPLGCISWLLVGLTSPLALLGLDAITFSL